MTSTPERTQPGCERATIEARLAELRAAQAAATGWGAAVGARHEEIKSLEGRLRAMTQTLAPSVEMQLMAPEVVLQEARELHRYWTKENRPYSAGVVADCIATIENLQSKIAASMQSSDVRGAIPDNVRGALESIAGWRNVNISGEYEHGLRDIIRSITDCAATALDTLTHPVPTANAMAGRGWRTDFDNAPSPCLGWCKFPAGEEVRMIYRSREGWTSHGSLQIVVAWQPRHPSPHPPQPQQNPHHTKAGPLDMDWSRRE